jgi:putative peptidoglycan lipid II flippase
LAEPIVETESTAPVGLRKGRAVGIVGVFTVVVSVVGYLREAALAARFGVSSTMDAYFGAIFIPNILYFILIAGTVSPILIPILLQQDEGADQARRSETFSVVTNFSLLMLFAVVACCLPAAHLWLGWLFPGFSPTTLEMAVRLVYLIFPAVLFLAMAGILTAVLNGFHRFALASFAPAFASILVIVGVLFARGDWAIYVVGIATAAGYLMQCLVLIPPTAALGIRYRLILNLRHPAIAKLLRMGIPLFLYLAVASASTVLERNIASRLSAGAVSTLTYAVRLFTVPSNFLAAPLAIVAYPGFAREAARVSRGELSSQVSRMFRLVVFLFLPITMWTVINSLPITRLLYEHGRFLAADSLSTAQVLSFYSVGILPNAIALVLLRCYFAIEDTVTPLLAEVFSLASFAVTAPIAAHHFGIVGLVAARAGTFFLVGGILVYILARRKSLLRLDWGFFRFLVRAFAAALAMGVISWFALQTVRGRFDSGGTLIRLVLTGVLIAVSGGIYLALARLLKLDEFRQVWRTAMDLIPGGNRSSL